MRLNSRRQLVGEPAAAAKQEHPARFGLRHLRRERFEITRCQPRTADMQDRGFPLHPAMPPDNYHQRVGLPGQRLAQQKKFFPPVRELLRGKIRRQLQGLRTVATNENLLRGGGTGFKHFEPGLELIVIIFFALHIPRQSRQQHDRGLRREEGLPPGGGSRKRSRRGE